MEEGAKFKIISMLSLKLENKLVITEESEPLQNVGGVVVYLIFEVFYPHQYPFPKKHFFSNSFKWGSDMV